jgi:G:T-mismatch repair DNA endonuclease (very short patch repair protein)
MISEIKRCCYVNNKLVPKRNLNWLSKNNYSLYKNLIDLFPSYQLPQILVFIENNIPDETKIPLCNCGKKVIVYRNKLLEFCSNKCTIKSEKTQLKTKETCIKKYNKQRKWGNPIAGNDHYTKSKMKNLEDIHNKKIMETLSNEHWSKTSEHFGLTLNSHSSAFKFMEANGYPIKTLNGTSRSEKEVKEFIDSLGIEYKENNKQIIKPYELDIYIPEKKIAIEYNGLYWHSSGSKETDNEKLKYHLMKTDMCEEKGIQLLHIFENEWTDTSKKEIWKSVIRHKLGLSKRIYARNCVIKEVSTKTANDFCEVNHLQGKCVASFAFGLFYDNELVQVVTFGKSRYNKSVDLELLRMCSKINTCIIGGASKLLKDFNFISYANRRWSYGKVYETLGMKLTTISPPCYYYIDKDKLYHRSSFMKHKLKDKLEIFDQNKTEVENCYVNGLRRIWDSGNLVYIKE